MPKTTLRWQFSSQAKLTQWYGHVQLLPERVLGQWFCLNRETGEKLWQHRLFRANTVCGVDSGVIVASETRSDGPWTGDLGCYGISLENGQLLWTSHQEGITGQIYRLFDYIPGFTNDLRDYPIHIESGQVFCQSGRVLEIQTGSLLKKLPASQFETPCKESSLAQQLYQKMRSPLAGSLLLENSIKLVIPEAEPKEMRKNFKLHAETKAGDLLWKLTFPQTGRCLDGSYFSYRLLPPELYFVVSEERPYQPHPRDKHYVIPNPTRWWLVVVNLTDGQIREEIPLGTGKCHLCRIEDADEQTVLVSQSDKQLFCFDRASADHAQPSEN